MQRFSLIHKLSSLMLLCTFSLMICPLDVQAAELTVKIIVSPNSTSIPAGSDEVALTAQATGTDLTYKWELQGTGTISGNDGPGVFYIPPATISGSSQKAIVSISVTDKHEKTVKESVTLHIGPAEASTDEDEQSSDSGEGMGKGAKIALGAGALAAAGGIAALALGGGGDSDDNGGPFSGTFVRNYSGETTQGNPYNAVDTLRLTQNGSSISGNITVADTLVGCCTASFSVPVSGTANGISAVLTWGAGEARCECTEWIYTTSRDAVTDVNASLINSDSILKFAGGAEAVRRSLVRKLSTDGNSQEDENSLLQLEHFFRE